MRSPISGTPQHRVYGPLRPTLGSFENLVRKRALLGVQLLDGELWQPRPRAVGRRCGGRSTVLEAAHAKDACRAALDVFAHDDGAGELHHGATAGARRQGTRQLHLNGMRSRAVSVLERPSCRFAADGNAAALQSAGQRDLLSLARLRENDRDERRGEEKHQQKCFHSFTLILLAVSENVESIQSRGRAELVRGVRTKSDAGQGS